MLKKSYFSQLLVFIVSILFFSACQNLQKTSTPGNQGESLAISANLESENAGENFAVSSNYYGIVRYIPFERSGNIGNVEPTDSPVNIGWGNHGIGLGDFDNDSLVDYVAGGTTSYYTQVSISFHKKLGEGNDFATGVNIIDPGFLSIKRNNLTSLKWQYYVMDFAVADYNEDGNLDFAVNNYQKHYAEFFLGNGDGTFRHSQSFYLGFPSIGMDAEDINGDGHADFISAQYYSYHNAKKKLRVLLGDGSGNFSALTIELNPMGNNYYDYRYYWGITLSDFDNDGKVDAVTNSYYHVFGNNKMLGFYKGNGDGTFKPEPVKSLPQPNSSYLYSLESLDNADINQDGNMDIIMAASFNRTVLVALGNGDGTFRFSDQDPVYVGDNHLFGISTLPFDVGINKATITDEAFIDIDKDTIK